MEDTIVAISTPIGNGGIGIIRISGEESLKLALEVFEPARKNVSNYFNSNDFNMNDSELANSKFESENILKNRVLTYGHIVDRSEGKIIDEVLCVYMKGPKTYTCEDVVEINCHGGTIPLSNTLKLLVSKGARLAEPGEFTKRAFLNGRLDLAQAEAIIDVIGSKSQRGFDSAISQLSGLMSNKIKHIREQLMEILIQVAVNIDYPDEDIEELTYEKLEAGLKSVNEDIEALLKSSDTGRIINQGLNISIIGKPNVGKSSLMNNLLKESRAIVTEIAGTTRDTIEENMTIRGIPINLTDTAGIRDTDDIIEKIGIEKSKKSLENADLVLVLLDSSRAFSDEDMEILKLSEGKKRIIIINKSDLEKSFDENYIESLTGSKSKIITASMNKGDGISELEDYVENLVYEGSVEAKDHVFITSVRHKELVEKAEKSIRDSLYMTSIREPLEIIEIDINSAYENLGLIIGEEVEDDVLKEVFSRFCLGK